MSAAQHCLDEHRGDTAHQTAEVAVTEWLRNSKADANITQPACQLPNELLVHIFTLYAQIFPYNKTLGVYSWIKLLLVCKHWHNVACATPKLWRYIKVESSNTEWVSLCLTRSAVAQIDVSIVSEKTSLEIHAMLSLNLHRVRWLSLEHPLPYRSSRLPTLLRHGAPALEELLAMYNPF